ncbi:MAG TPA: aspartate aminotransferase family protein [bacterium]|nr:aspartate aminotransferase family protein [bacterium]
MAAVPQSASARLYERARKVMPGGNSRTTVFTAPHPLYAQSGKGCRLTDVDGVERIDFINNYTALIHGHLHPAIMEAVQQQLALGTCFANPTESEIALAEELCARVPAFEQVRFANSGTEAVMNAIKAARAYTGSPKIAKCEGLYHGSYDPVETSLDPTPETWGGAEPVARAYSGGTPPGVLADVLVLPFNETATARRLLEAHADELAAVIVDPMPNRSGLIPALPEYLAMLREVTATHGIVLIFDEVISFRVGYEGYQGEAGIEPDLTTLGKIIGGGFPVGAVAGKAEVMAVFDPSRGKPALPHGGTFNANPVTMVAGLAAMRLLTREAFARLEALGDAAREACRGAFRLAEMPGQVTGRGSLLMLHLTDKPLCGYRDAWRDPAEQARFGRLYRHLSDKGAIISPSGLVSLSTPMGDAEVERLGEALLASLKTLRAESLAAT